MTGNLQSSTNALNAHQSKIITHDEVEERAQKLLWSVFKDDVGIKAMTTNILDKEPEELNRGMGWPYIIVPIPNVSEENKTMRKKELTVTFNCSVFAKTTPTLAKLQSNMRAAVRKNIPLLGNLRLEHTTSNSDGMGAYELDDGRMAYRANMEITFRGFVNKMDDS